MRKNSPPDCQLRHCTASSDWRGEEPENQSADAPGVVAEYASSKQIGAPMLSLMGRQGG